VVGVGWDTPSFPSGHAHLWVQAGIVYGALYRRFRTPLYIFAVLSVYSRPYTGNHFVLDALAGAALGGMSGWLQLLINHRLGLIPGPDEEPEEPTIPWRDDDDDGEGDGDDAACDAEGPGEVRESAPSEPRARSSGQDRQ
jgi:hypothetical protein